MAKILHHGTEQEAEQVYAVSHAALMSKGYPFTMVYNEAWDAGQDDHKMDSSTVAFIATMLPSLPLIAEDTTIYWHTTIHGILIRIEDYPTTRLTRKVLQFLGSDQRIRWVEIVLEDNPTFIMGLMFNKQYEALL